MLDFKAGELVLKEVLAQDGGFDALKGDALHALRKSPLGIVDVSEATQAYKLLAYLHQQGLCCKYRLGDGHARFFCPKGGAIPDEL